MKRRRGKKTPEPKSRAKGFDPLHGGYLTIDAGKWAEEQKLRQKAEAACGGGRVRLA